MKLKRNTPEEIVKRFQEEFNMQERALLIGLALTTCLMADTFDETVDFVQDAAEKSGFPDFREDDLTNIAHRLWKVTGWKSLSTEWDNPDA